MTVLEELMASREDISPDVIHLTRANPELGLSAMQVLQKMVREGFITPTFAPRRYGARAEERHVIKGKHPAVCFTEQPLGTLPATLRILAWLYEPYGLIFDKRYVYHLGGRPVIYGDDDAFAALPRSLEYLWSFFDPNRRDAQGKLSPVDWTHEREWRFRIPDGEDELPGFPVNFCEPSCPEHTPFRILVESEGHASQMRAFIERLQASPPIIAPRGSVVQEKYEQGIAAARVISLENLTPFC